MKKTALWLFCLAAAAISGFFYVDYSFTKSSGYRVVTVEKPSPQKEFLQIRDEKDLKRSVQEYFGESSRVTEIERIRYGDFLNRFDATRIDSIHPDDRIWLVHVEQQGYEDILHHDAYFTSFQLAISAKGEFLHQVTHLEK